MAGSIEAINPFYSIPGESQATPLCVSNDRITDLEARFAWLERHVTEQDRAVLALSDELRRVKEELTRQRERAAGSVPDAGPSDPSEKPPHY